MQTHGLNFRGVDQYVRYTCKTLFVSDMNSNPDSVHNTCLWCVCCDVVILVLNPLTNHGPYK